MDHLQVNIKMTIHRMTLNNNMRHRILLLIFISGLSSCILSTWDVRLSLTNNSNQTVRYIREIKNKNEFIPDTTYCDSEDIYELAPHYKQTLRSQNRWEYALKKHPEKILRIYIISEDSIKKYGACKVLKEHIFMKRFDLTYDDLEKINWNVEYK
jgi:hypothetical protein